MSPLKDANPLEGYKRDNQFTLDRIKAREAEALELTKLAGEQERSLARLTILLNAGGLLAFLGLYSTLLTRLGTSGVRQVVEMTFVALALWCIGLILGGAANVLAFLSQRAFLKAACRRLDMMDATSRDAHAELPYLSALASQSNKTGRAQAAWFIAATLASLLFFVAAVGSAAHALSRL